MFPTKQQQTMRREQSSLLALCLTLVLPACTKNESGPDYAYAAKGPAAQVRTKAPIPADAPLVEPSKPPPGPPNPLVGAKLFVDPESLAMLHANHLRKSDPDKASVLDRIAQQPQGLWLGEWNTDIFRAVEHFVGRAVADGSVPVIIAYNIPLRDCGGESGGGLTTGEQYKHWISDVAAGIGNDPAVVILEPDALGHFQECLTEDQKTERMEALKFGVRVLRQNPSTAVYLDAGHARWQPADEMAQRLRMAGVEDANGFALNVSNYVSTEENLEYGRELSTLLGGVHFVIDTSRNGAGPYEEAQNVEETWCNPPGRKVGAPPTTNTGEPLCDGFLWLKRPGESDGKCGGGPVAGAFWEERALELAR